MRDIGLASKIFTICLLCVGYSKFRIHLELSSFIILMVYFLSF